jgi:hypothetical protein
MNFRKLFLYKVLCLTIITLITYHFFTYNANVKENFSLNKKEQMT